MSLITLLLFVAGSVLLIWGNKKNNRASLTLSAFLWLVSGNWSDFANGFIDGMHSVDKPTVSSSVK